MLLIITMSQAQSARFRPQPAPSEAEDLISDVLAAGTVLPATIPSRDPASHPGDPWKVMISSQYRVGFQLAAFKMRVHSQGCEL